MPMLWEMKMEVYDLLRVCSNVLVGVYLWCVCQNVCPGAGNGLVSSSAC